MDNQYLDALLLAVLAFATLILVAVSVIASTTIMHRVALSKEKRGGLGKRRGLRRPKKDDKVNVVLAAAVVAYLKAEEESRR